MTATDLEYPAPQFTARECWPARLINANENCLEAQQDHSEAIDQYIDGYFTNHERVDEAYASLKAATDRFLDLYRQWTQAPHSFDDDPRMTDPAQTIDRR